MPNSSGLLMRTARLDLVAGTAELANIELQGRDRFAAALRCAVPSGWPPGEYDRGAIEFLRDRMSAGGPSHAGWYTWYGITRNADGTRDTLVAAGGYFCPPADGTVEIGYSVVPEAQGIGIATEMARALVARAFEHPEVRAVIAHTFDSNPASIRVLDHCGFHRVGSGIEALTVQFRLDRPA